MEYLVVSAQWIVNTVSAFNFLSYDSNSDKYSSLLLLFLTGGSKSRGSTSKAKDVTSLTSADESDSQSSLKASAGPSSAKRTRYDGEGSLDDG